MNTNEFELDFEIGAKLWSNCRENERSTVYVHDVANFDALIKAVFTHLAPVLSGLDFFRKKIKLRLFSLIGMEFYPVCTDVQFVIHWQVIGYRTWSFSTACIPHSTPPLSEISISYSRMNRYLHFLSNLMNSEPVIKSHVPGFLVSNFLSSRKIFEWSN